MVGRPYGQDYLALMQRATQRPAGVKPPAHWQNDPVPEPKAVTFQGLVEKGRPDPVRYGDWELKGIAVDF